MVGGGELRRELAPFAERVNFKWFNELSFEDTVKEVAHLPPDSAVFWGMMYVDVAGVVHEGNSGLNKLASSASAPVFSFVDAYLGEGVLGGPMHSVGEGSKKAAEVALRILDGEKAGDIKTPPTTFAVPTFDWRQMQRWGIRESDLPPGSKILFKPPSTWETYRSQIIAITAVILLQGALIFGLLFEHRRRRRLEVQGRQRMAELAHMNRQATAGHLSASIAHERNQPLGAILNNVEAASLMTSTCPRRCVIPNVDRGEMIPSGRRTTHSMRRRARAARTAMARGNLPVAKALPIRAEVPLELRTFTYGKSKTDHRP